MSWRRGVGVERFNILKKQRGRTRLELKNGDERTGHLQKVQCKIHTRHTLAKTLNQNPKTTTDTH